MRRRRRRNPTPSISQWVGGAALLTGGVAAVVYGKDTSRAPGDNTLLGQDFGAKIAALLFGSAAIGAGAGLVIGAYSGSPKLGLGLGSIAGMVGLGIYSRATRPALPSGQ